jgi:hypothetical protein
MSSESHDRKDAQAESTGRTPEGSGRETHPPSSRPVERTSARAPSAWGAARDALAAVHNLEALLRNEKVPTRTIRDLIPELRAGAGVLRAAFDKARAAGEPAAAAVGDHGAGRVEALESLLGAADSSSDPRDELAARARTLAQELEASADLLALLERASAPSPTTVSADLLVRETGRLWGSGRGLELSVRFDAPDPDGVITTDPYVAGPLLALLVAWVHSSSARGVALRARCTSTQATFVVAPADAAGAAGVAAGAGAARPALPHIAMRVLPCVPPTAQAARRVAEQIGAELQWEEGRGSLTLPLDAG